MGSGAAFAMSPVSPDPPRSFLLDELDVPAWPEGASGLDGAGAVVDAPLPLGSPTVPTTCGMPLSHQSLCSPAGRALSKPIGKGQSLGLSLFEELRCADG